MDPNKPAVWRGPNLASERLIKLQGSGGPKRRKRQRGRGLFDILGGILGGAKRRHKKRKASRRKR